MSFIDRLSDDELLREVRAAVAALPDAPVTMRRAAMDLWPAPPAPALSGLVAGAGALLRRVRAELSFDSWAAPALALGMRSLRSPTRHLLFSAEGRDIDLRVTPRAHAFSLTGQILGPDDAGTVELAATEPGATAGHRVELDALGEFHLDDVPPGLYVLTLRLGSDEIVLPPIDMGEPPR